MKRICCVIADESESIIVYWNDKGLICKKSPYSSIRVIRKLMNAQFRSMNDTRNFAKQLNIYHKIPVYLGENIMFFPTAGLRSTNCHWVRFDHLISVIDNKTESLLVFEWRNMQDSLKISCSRRMIIKQIRRCKEIYDKIHSFNFQQELKID